MGQRIPVTNVVVRFGASVPNESNMAITIKLNNGKTVYVEVPANTTLSSDQLRVMMSRALSGKPVEPVIE